MAFSPFMSEKLLSAVVCVSWSGGEAYALLLYTWTFAASIGRVLSISP